MAFLFKNSIASQLRSQSQATKSGSLSLTRRQFHVEPGTREKALLAADPSLKRFKSPKKGALAVKRIGDVLTVVVVAGCCYEIYVKTIMRKEGQTNA